MAATAALAPEEPARACPAPAPDRILLLDALRGFALLGILLANMLYWSGWIFMKEPARIALAGASGEAAQHAFHYFLVDGKFYTIFSLLFGLGFALQISRLEARGADGVRIFRRRLLVLLAIGIVHLQLVWDGDILTLYALLGLLLPFFRHWSGRSLLAAAFLLIFLVPIAGEGLFQAAGLKPHLWFYQQGDAIARSLGGTPGSEVAWLQREGLQSFLSWVLGGSPYRVGNLIESWRLPKVLGIMLLGLWAGRRIAAGTLIEDRRLLRHIFLAGLIVGAPASYLYAAGDELGQASLPSTLGTVPLALAIASGFALLWPHARSALGFFVAPGRMALTNYLMHSLVGITLFYGIGFGLVGRLSPLQFYGVASLIFALQILLSRLWLARFPQGPMERLWRLGTYRRRTA